MSAWIGPLGSLIEFKCPSAVESSSEDPHTYFRSLGGDVAVTRLGDGTRPRVWDVSVSAARPDQVTALQSLSEGQWGPGPFVFIPPAAETLNLLGRRDALAMGTPYPSYTVQTPGSLVTTSEGVAGSSYSALSTTPNHTALGAAPVLPGRSVTGRVWAQATPDITAEVFLRFYTAGNTQVGASSVPSTAATSGAYLHATAVAPATAAYAILFARGSILTHPQITWASVPRPWVPSSASQNVVVSPLTGAVRRATGMAGEETITDHRFTVTELRA